MSQNLPLNNQDEGPREFTSAPIRPADLLPGDFVTVISRTIPADQLASFDPSSAQRRLSRALMREARRRRSAQEIWSPSIGESGPQETPDESSAKFYYPNQGLPLLVVGLALPFIYTRQIPGIVYPLTGDHAYQIINVTTDDVRKLPR